MGRPPKLVEDDRLVEQIGGLAFIQCTEIEAAAVLGVCLNTFRDFLAKNPDSRFAWENGPARGRVSLRREQFQLAKKGNARMQTWLGKQWLKQADKVEITGASGGPIVGVSIKSDMTPAQAADAYAMTLNGGP